MQPEGDPGQDDDQAGRDVDVDDVVAETSREVELADEAGVVT